MEVLENTKMGLSDHEKEQIANDLSSFVTNRAGSANKASKMLKRVNISYISQMVAGLDSEKRHLWDKMSDDAWRNVQKQVSVKSANEWVVVPELDCTRHNLQFLEEARKYSLTFAIIGRAGCSKTESAKIECENNANSWWIDCRPYHAPKFFLKELMRVMGLKAASTNIYGLMDIVKDHIRKQSEPLIIANEFDKLPPKTRYYFISLYNDLEDECGLVLMGAPNLQKDLERGKELDRKGYEELVSRVGGRFISAMSPSESDMREVIKANGVYDGFTINKIVNDSDGDLRRVKRLVHAQLRKGGQS